MKLLKELFLVGILAGALLLSSDAVFSASTRLVIYSDGSAFVQEHRQVQLCSGECERWLSGLPEKLIANSVLVQMPKGVELLETSLSAPPGDPAQALSLKPGDSVAVFLRTDLVVRGRLVSLLAGDVVLRNADGLMHVPAQAVASVVNPAPERLPPTETSLKVRFRSRKAGLGSLELMYLTDGLSWEAVYVATLAPDHSKLTLESSVFLTNHSGADYQSADLTLVAGQIHRARKPVRPLYRRRASLMKAEVAAAPTSFEESALYEYHQYRLARPVDLPDGTRGLSIPLLPTAEFGASDEFVYDGQLDDDKVRATVVFRNHLEALPGGVVRVFDAAREQVNLIGESVIDHTPKGEKVHLFVGYSFDLVGKRVQVSSKRLSKTVRQETWRITIRNHKTEPVTVTVREHAYGDWDIVRCSESWKRISVRRFEIPLMVPPTGEKSVTYTIEYHM